MRVLYPRIKPYRDFYLDVTPPHRIYVEECGNPDGLPVLFVHGGPGSGCEDWHRRFFDPEVYRIILFDQRGAGRSTPHAELEGNTTQALVADMEAIREELGIAQWVLFGGSWGSTLSLVYAETHPEHVLGLILRGIFLCREREIDWFYQQGASRVYPDYWQDFIEPIPPAERDEMVAAYYKRLTGEDEIARMHAARAWSVWEGRTSNLVTKQSVLEHFADPHTALALARIECHYFVNHIFLPENSILNNIEKIADIPGIIVQGRYDMVCPMESAWDLHRAWPMSDLEIIPEAGHSATEPGIIDALIKATHDMVRRLE